LGVVFFGLLALPALLAQNSQPAEEGIPTDWSHHHLIFSRPATAEQARRVEQDPRYWQQQQRNQLRKPAAVADSEIFRELSRVGGSGGKTSPPPHIKTHRDWSEDLGTSGSVGAGNFPAKYSFSGGNAVCGGTSKADFVVYSTGLAGAIGQATIVAYTNLYTGCTGTVPTVYWAYNTGSTARILTSPAFSRDGKQVAFVQDDLSASNLVLLKWASSTTETVSSPDTLTPVSNAAYHSCTAPCMTTIPLRDTGGAATHDTTSSVFLDLTNDTAWVGDQIGLLHQFHPVFAGAPTEIRSGGFPAQMTSGNALTSPVHDFASGRVFVGDAGGFVYAVDASGGGVTQSGELDFGVGIVEGPVVDSTSGFLYAFASSDGSGGCTGGADCTGVYVLSTGFFAGDFGAETVVGNSTIPPATPSPMYIGAFDSTYENSTNATGNLYVCGNTGGQPTIYQVAINAGALGTVTAGPVLSTTGTTPPCSPVTDIYNANTTGGPTEFIFASAQDNGTSSACTSGGCIFNFNDTPWKPLTVYAVGQEVLDSNLHIQVVVSPASGGESGVGPPSWTTAVGQITLDGTGASTVHWQNQGSISAITPASWLASHHFAKGTEILDSNGNIELVTTSSAGSTTGGSTPSWKTTAGAVTIDNTIRWTNVGAIATAALKEAGGTSGIIIDNTVGSGTIVGGSQVYFSTLSDQSCGTSGTGGCAVQASQSALK